MENIESLLFRDYIGGFLIVVACANFIRIYIKSSWATTKGKITRSTVYPENSNVFIPYIGEYVISAIHFKNTRYKPIFIYEYFVDGGKYLSGSIYSAPLWVTTISDLFKFIDGSEVVVRYNIKKPEKSYLIRSSIIPTLIILVTGVAVIFLKTHHIEVLKEFVLSHF